MKPLILNLGSGAKTCDHPAVVNVDWSPYLRLKANPVGRRLAPLMLRGVRRRRYLALPDNVMVHDLRRGIPFEDSSIEIVYHSHLLEHIDRDLAEGFMREVLRVLVPGGAQRIVVPDLERVCREYLAHLDMTDDQGEQARHDEYVAAIIEQSVRRENYARAGQSWFVGRVEGLLLGDARDRGETHQWMYDRANLFELLRCSGFEQPTQQSFDTSSISEWPCSELDLGEAGEEYKPGSLYVEARRPR